MTPPKQTSTPGRRSHSGVHAKPCLVLVVDDDSVNREVVCACLNQAGLRTATADNGASALESARTARPDLILMDLFMPVMSGSEAAAALCDLPATRGVPIVMLTSMPACVPPQTRARCSAVLAKGGDLDALLATIRDTLAASARCRASRS